MDMDFATSCPLVRPRLPHIQFLFVGSRLCSTLPSDSPSRFCPCALLVLHLHQVAQGTFTPTTVGHVRHTGRCAPPPAVACGQPSLPLRAPLLRSSCRHRRIAPFDRTQRCFFRRPAPSRPTCLSALDSSYP